MMNKSFLISLFILGTVLLGVGIYDNHPQTITDDIFRISGLVIYGFFPYYVIKRKEVKSK